MTHNIFKQYPYWVNSTGWYELIRAKNKNDEDKVVRLYERLRRICHNYFMVIGRGYIEMPSFVG